MADIYKINGVAIANIEKVNSHTLAVGDKIMGIAKPAAAASNIYEFDFNSTTGTGNSSATTLPSGWAKADSGNMTVYSSTTDTDLGGYQNTRGWVFTDGESSSTYTGVGGGMQNGIGTTDGAWNAYSAAGNPAYRYLLFETSTISTNKRGLIRTGALDFSGYTTITLHMWIHAYGSRIGTFGVACTTNASSADSGVQSGTGLGFTSDTAGGGTLVYDSNGDGSLDTSAVRITSQINTDGDQYNETQTAARKWRKCTVDLSAAAGQSTNYIYFFYKTTGTSNVYYRGDFCIDNVYIAAS